MLTAEKVKEVFAKVAVEKVDSESESSPFWQIDESSITDLKTFFEGKEIDGPEVIVVQERVSSDKRSWISTGFRGIKAPKGAKDGDEFTRIARATASRPYAQAGINRGDVVAILVK